MSPSIATRPLTEEERADLADSATGQGAGASGCAVILALAGGPVIGLLGAALVGVFLEGLGLTRLGPLLLLAGAAGGLALGARSLAATRARDRAMRQVFQHDLDAGEAQVTTYAATAALRLEEFEDEGPGYFFDVGEGKLLFLQSPRLGDLEQEEGFPGREIDVARTAHSGMVLDVRTRGEKLTAEAAPATLLDVGCLPTDGEVLGGSLATLAEDLVRMGRGERD